MIANKTVKMPFRLLAGLLSLVVSTSAFAGRYWLGSTDEYWGTDANWASSSETGSANKGKPGEGTGTTYWYTYKNGLTVFDEAGLPPENVNVGTQSDSTFVWRATDPAYGMTATGKELKIEASSSYTNTSLKIESGTYSFQKVSVGYSSAHTTFTMDGGTLSTGNSNPSSGADFVLGNGDGETSSAEMTVNGGTVVVNGNCLYVGYNGTGSLTINDGTVEVMDTDSYGLCFGHNNSHGRDAGTLVLNGGTLKIPRVRDGMIQTGSRLVFNGGTVKPTRATSNFIKENEKLTCEVQSGGLCFDTAGYDITIAHELVLASGVSSAPLVKRGEGTLTLSGTTPFAAGDITVYGGSVVVGGMTYGVNAVEPIDASAGGDLGTMTLHGDKLEAWLEGALDYSGFSVSGVSGGTSFEKPVPFTVAVGSDMKTYMNLETGKTYNDTLGGVNYSFTTKALAPRTLQIDTPSGTVANVRDVGSWPLESLNGKKMNQGVIFRGGNLDDFITATAEQKTASVLTRLGLKTEIELRPVGVDQPVEYSGVTASFAADGCEYYDCGMSYNGGPQLDSGNGGNFTNQIQRVFSKFGTANSLPAYFHCRIGRDRTGMVGLLLLGMMGVEEEVLYRDYLISNFAKLDSGLVYPSHVETFLRYIHRGWCKSGEYVYNDNDYGPSVAARCRAYLEMCGVTAAELANITQALSGETPAEVLARVNAYETENNFRTVSYVGYEGSSTTNAMHRLAAGRHILPTAAPTREGYTFQGWDVEHETVYDQTTGDSVVYALWEVSSATPREFEWDNAAGTSTMADGGNWKVKNSEDHDLPGQYDSVNVTSSAAHPVLNFGEIFNVTNMYVGRTSDNYPIVDITNGTVYVGNMINIGRYGNKAEMNIYDGVVNAKQIAVGNWGSHDYNQLNIYGGDVTVTGGNWPGALVLGLQTESRGDILIKGGTLVSLNTVKVGFSNLSNIGGPSATYNSSITVDGGLFCVTGSVDVADSDSGDGGGGGRIYVNSGAMTVSSDLNISQTSNSWGQVDVFTGGSLTVDGTIRVGNNKYAQHAVLNVAGGTVDVKSLSVARECDGYVYVTDGGTIYAESIDKAQGAPSTAHPYFYFDDANIVAKSGYAYTFASSSGITLGAGGLTFDTNGYSPTIQAFTAIDGIGGLTKKGEGKLELVANSFDFAGAYNAHGVISVEKGTLKMPAGQTFYVEGTDVAEGATLDLNGSTLVIVTKSIEDATWTNATGDRDAANPANWSTTVKYYGEDGKEIEAIRVTLDGVLPAATSDVRIPIDSDYPTNLDPATVKSVTYVSTRDVSLIVDFAATYDNYAAPSLTLSGDVKVLGNLNGLLASAIAWYDPSDVTTLNLNGDGTVNGLVNKGTLGSVLDFVPMGDTSAEKTMPVIERTDGWKLDCVSFALTNRGFKTSYTSSLAGDKTLIVVDRHMEGDGEWYPFLSNGNDTHEWVGAAELWGSKFRYYAGNDWGESLNPSGAPDTTGKNTVRSIRVASKALKAELYYAADGSVYTGSTDIIANLISEDMRLCMGERSWWNGSAKSGYVGESLAFDSALSDNAVTAVRQYLVSKWLEGDAVAPSAGTTAFDALILEGANVDMDGAAVSVGILGGYGSITNCASLRITDGFACDVDGEGNAPKIVVSCNVDATGTTVADVSDALIDIVRTGATVTLVETTGTVTMPSKILFKVNNRDYIIYKTTSGEKSTIFLSKDRGFSIRLR